MYVKVSNVACVEGGLSIFFSGKVVDLFQYTE